MRLYACAQVCWPEAENMFPSGFNICESTKGKEQGFLLILEIPE